MLPPSGTFSGYLAIYTGKQYNQFEKLEFVGAISNSTHILPMRDVVFASNEIYFCHKQQMEATKMNQLTTGKFIAHKRKEKNFTQEQLAEKLGVSNKTVSKWETGDSLR